MNIITKLLPGLLVFSAAFTLNAETITVESDLSVKGALSIHSPTVEITDPDNAQSIDLSALATEAYVNEQFSNAVFEESIILGSNPAVALSEDTAIVTGAYLGSIHPWNRLYLYNSIVNNYLASADKKFSVGFSGNLTHPNLGKLFDGNFHEYKHNLIHPGETATIKIDFTKSIPHLVFPKGSLFISSHFKSKFEVTGVRMINKDDLVTDIPAAKISMLRTAVHKRAIWEIQVPNSAPLRRVKSIEIDLLGANSNAQATPIAEIEYFLRSPAKPEVSGSLVTKYNSETLYETLSFKNAAGNKTLVLNAETGNLNLGGMLRMKVHSGANASEGAIRFGNDGSGSKDFLGYVDGTWKSLTQSAAGSSETDQTLTLIGNQLTISGTGGNTVTLPAGMNGADGANGSTWLTGTGTPDNVAGTDGDLYMNTANGDFYVKASGDWGNAVNNLRGPQGIAGPAGQSGDAYFSENANGDVSLASSRLGLGTATPAVRLDVVGDAQIAGQLTVDGTLVLTKHQGDIPMYQPTN